MVRIWSAPARGPATGIDPEVQVVGSQGQRMWREVQPRRRAKVVRRGPDEDTIRRRADGRCESGSSRAERTDAGSGGPCGSDPKTGARQAAWRAPRRGDRPADVIGPTYRRRVRSVGSPPAEERPARPSGDAAAASIG